MRVTKSQLKQIIKEEVEQLLMEVENLHWSDRYTAGINPASKTIQSSPGAFHARAAAQEPRISWKQRKAIDKANDRARGRKRMSDIKSGKGLNIQKGSTPLDKSKPISSSPRAPRSPAMTDVQSWSPKAVRKAKAKGRARDLAGKRYRMPSRAGFGRMVTRVAAGLGIGLEVADSLLRKHLGITPVKKYDREKRISRELAVDTHGTGYVRKGAASMSPKMSPDTMRLVKQAHAKKKEAPHKAAFEKEMERQDKERGYLQTTGAVQGIPKPGATRADVERHLRTGRKAGT